MKTDIVSTLVTGLVIVMCACAAGAVITYVLQRVFEVERKKRKPRRHQSATAIMEAIANAVPQSTTSAEESELALARAGLHGVGFMCTVVDVYEDGTTTYDSLSKWNHEAALSMQRLFSRC